MNDAERDAQRDSLGEFGRWHGHGPLETYTDTGGVQRTTDQHVYNRHHTADTFEAKCPECKAEASKGQHPSKK
jgi:hypothetical protein